MACPISIANAVNNNEKKNPGYGSATQTGPRFGTINKKPVWIPAGRKSPVSISRILRCEEIRQDGISQVNAPAL
jgi:hypothetical protein